MLDQFMPQFIEAVTRYPDQIFIRHFCVVEDYSDLFLLDINGLYPIQVPDEPSQSEGALIAEPFLYFKEKLSHSDFLPPGPHFHSKSNAFLMMYNTT